MVIYGQRKSFFNGRCIKSNTIMDRYRDQGYTVSV